MIVRKPYAFLIKNFRIIHGILFLFVLYLAKQTLDIYDFYNQYVNTHAYQPGIDLVAEYISIGMFVVAIIAIVINFIIYYILSLKNKSRKVYMYSIIMYIVLIGFFVAMIIGFGQLQGKVFTVETRRAYRDASFIMLLPQVILSIILFARTLGFNIKQFNFKKDLEDMNIEISDSEEVELNLGNNNYKYMRAFRKLTRLTKYFVIENKLFIIIVCSILIFGISLFAFARINVYKNRVFERSTFVANNMTYDVKEAFITQTDINNMIINKNKYYVIIKISMNNTTVNDANLNRDTFRLQAKTSLLYPNMTIGERFLDLGKIFKSQTFKSGLSEDQYVIFEVDESEKVKEYILKISSSIINSNNESGYKEAIIKPDNLDDVNDNGTKSIPNEVSFDNSLLGKTSLMINSTQIENKFKEEYTYSTGNKIKTGIYTIIPESTSVKDAIILKIDSTIIVDETVHMSDYIKKPADIYKYYGFISYRTLGRSYSVKLVPKDVIFETDKYSYFEVPGEIRDADKIELILLIRGQKYTFVLK